MFPTLIYLFSVVVWGKWLTNERKGSGGAALMVHLTSYILVLGKDISCGKQTKDMARNGSKELLGIIAHNP